MNVSRPVVFLWTRFSSTSALAGSRATNPAHKQDSKPAAQPKSQSSSSQPSTKQNTFSPIQLSKSSPLTLEIDNYYRKLHDATKDPLRKKRILLQWKTNRRELEQAEHAKAIPTSLDSESTEMLKLERVYEHLQTKKDKISYERFVPYSLWQRKGYSTFRSWTDQLVDNIANRQINFQSLSTLVEADAVPGKPLGSVNPIKAFFKSLQTTSLSKNAYLYPLREIASEYYKVLQTAISKNDVHRISQLTRWKYQQECFTLASKLASPSSPTWTIESHIRPPRIISLRVEKGYYPKDPPSGSTWAPGLHRYIVGALVRFHTKQVASFPPSHPSSKPSEAKGPLTKEVEELLIFQKRMWKTESEEPWQFIEKIELEKGRKLAI